MCAEQVVQNGRGKTDLPVGAEHGQSAFASLRRPTSTAGRRSESHAAPKDRREANRLIRAEASLPEEGHWRVTGTPAPGSTRRHGSARTAMRIAGTCGKHCAAASATWTITGPVMRPLRPPASRSAGTGPVERVLVQEPHNATMELLRPVDGNFDAANDTRFDVSHTSVPAATYATIQASVVGHGPVPR